MKQFLILVLLLQKFYWINGQKATGIRTLAPVYVLTIGKNIRNGRDHGVSTSLNNSVGLNYSEINRKNVYPFRNYDVMLNYVKMEVTGGSMSSPGGIGGSHFNFAQKRIEMQFNSYLVNFGTLKKNSKFSLGVYTNFILYSKTEGHYSYNSSYKWDPTINYYRFIYSTVDLSHSQQIFNLGFTEKAMILLNPEHENPIYFKQAFKYGLFSETKNYGLVRSIQFDFGLLYFPDWSKTKLKK